MVFKFINGMSQQLGVAFNKVRLMHSDATQFGGAHRGKIGRVREQNYPSAKSDANN